MHLFKYITQTWTQLMKNNCIPGPTSPWPWQGSRPWPTTSARWNRVPWRGRPTSIYEKKRESYITHRSNHTDKRIEKRLTSLPWRVTSTIAQKQEDIRHPSISLNLNYDHLRFLHSMYIYVPLFSSSQNFFLYGKIYLSENTHTQIDTDTETHVRDRKTTSQHRGAKLNWLKALHSSRFHMMQNLRFKKFSPSFSA